MTRAIAHQFDSVRQQRHAVTLALWLFLSSELLIFAVLLVAYAVARHQSPAAFAQAGGHLYKWIGVANTGILLLSSGAMAMAAETPADRAGRKSAWLWTTSLLGAAFLAVKGVEYTLDIHESLLPAIRFDPAPFQDPARASYFFVLYWLMTGLHALHVAAGVLVIGVLARRVRRGMNSERASNATHAAALYWHFVDIVWLTLLPLLYLNP